MTVSAVLFTIVAATIAISALAVVLTRDVIRCAIWLLFTLIGTSLLYFLIGAEFLGAVQLIVYVGGTLVLVVFGVMLTSQAPGRQFGASWAERLIAGGITFGLFALLVSASLRLGGTMDRPAVEELPDTRTIGLGFLGFSDDAEVGYLLPFEIVSVHLLVVLIGAAYLARAKRRAHSEEPPRS